MALQTQQLERSFRYNSVDLIDPGAQYTPEQVRDFYAPTYPEILNAAIEGPEEKDGRLQYTFRRAVGTKGSGTPRRKFIAATVGTMAAAMIPRAIAAAPAQVVRVYRLNEFEWWAGPSLPACIADWKEETAFTEAELDDPRELTETEMNTLIFVHSDEEERPFRRHTFRAELDEQIAAGVSFPSFFATTEY